MAYDLRLDDRLCDPKTKDAKWRVVGHRAIEGHVKLFNCLDKSEQYKSLQWISEQLEGTLIVRREGMPRASAVDLNDPELIKSIEKRLGQLAQIQAIAKRDRISFNCAYYVAKQAHEEAQKAELNAWCAANGQGPAPLIERFPAKCILYKSKREISGGRPVLKGQLNKGNRQERYSQEVRALVAEVSEELYAKEGSRWTLKKLTARINTLAEARGIQPKWKTIGQPYIRTVIFDEISVDPEIDRMDPRLVAAAKSLAKFRIHVTQPFERVEQDAVHLPFVVDTPFGRCRNIWLVHAIDCATGVPLGWKLVIGAPRDSDSLACIEVILYSKKPHFERLDLTCSLDVFGTPNLLVFDNGPEARGARVENLTSIINQVMHCKSRHAHGKPYIERLNRSLKEALETLHGCTRMDGKDGMRDPEALGDRIMSIKELEQFIVGWYYKEWSNHELKRHLRTDFHGLTQYGATPASRIRTMIERCYAMPMSPPRRHWQLALYEHATGTLSRKSGINCNLCNYKGENLERLILRHGESLVKILIDPDDYRFIWVDEGLDTPLVRLDYEFLEPDSPAYTVAEMKERLRAINRPGEIHPEAKEWRIQVQESSVRPNLKPARKKQSQAEKNRAVAEAARDHAARERAIKQPATDLGAATPPGAIDSAASLPMSFDDISALPTLNRFTRKSTDAGVA